MAEVFDFGENDGFKVEISFYRDVKNTRELKEKLFKGHIQAAVLRSRLACNYFPILVSANKTAHSFKHGKMKTKTVHTELMYNLSPTHSISDSLKKFGIQDNDTEILVVCIYQAENEIKTNIHSNDIQGVLCSLDQLETFADQIQLKKIYKITDEELTIGSLSDAIICRIATKDAS